MAILDRIKQQDAGNIEPPAIALSGMVGANPASEGFIEQNASASRQKAESTAAGADDESDTTPEVWPHLLSNPSLSDMWETGLLTSCESHLAPLWQLVLSILSVSTSANSSKQLRGVKTAWMTWRLGDPQCKQC